MSAPKTARVWPEDESWWWEIECEDGTKVPKTKLTGCATKELAEQAMAMAWMKLIPKTADVTLRTGQARRGRPASEGPKRTHPITVMVTELEYAELRAVHGGVSLADHIRKLLADDLASRKEPAAVK